MMAIICNGNDRRKKWRRRAIDVKEVKKNALKIIGEEDDMTVMIAGKYTNKK